MSNKPKWYAYYRGSYNSTRAAEVREPYKIYENNWRYNHSEAYNTEEKAWDAFNEALVDHAKRILWYLHAAAGESKVFRKRLKNAGRDDIIAMFDDIAKLAKEYHDKI